MNATLDAVVHLIELRSKIVSNQQENYNWTIDDPVVGFAAPILVSNQETRKKLISHPKYSIIEKSIYNHTAKFAWFEQGLKEIVHLFHVNHIPVILLKGILFSETLYKNPGIRTLGDIDLLVPVEKFLDATKLLQTNRWAPVLDVKKEELYRGFFESFATWDWQVGEWSFQDPLGRVVDLHWHLIPGVWLRGVYPFDLQSIWSSAEPLQGDLIGAYTLSPVYNLLYCCLHFANHGCRNLRWLLDIDQLVRNYQANKLLNWEELSELARMWRMRSVTYHVLCCSRELFGTPIDNDVFHNLNPDLSARIIIKQILTPRDLIVSSSLSPGLKYPALLKLFLFDKYLDIIKVVRKVIYPDRVWRKRRYSGNQSIINHWKHIFRVINRGY